MHEELVQELKNAKDFLIHIRGSVRLEDLRILDANYESFKRTLAKAEARMMSVTSPECPEKHAKKCVNMHDRLLAALKRTVDMKDFDVRGTIAQIEALIAEAAE